MGQITNHQSYHPQIRSVISLFAILAMVTAVNVALALQPAQAVMSPNPIEERLITLTNQERTQLGLHPLTYNTQLQEAAREKAAGLLAEDYFDHLSPTGETPWQFIKAAGYDYVKAGENLAMDFADVNEVVPAWMASPSHRDNIVKPTYEEIGLAVLTGEFQGHQTTVIVQMFGTRPSSLLSIDR